MNILTKKKKGVEFIDYRSRFCDDVLTTALPRIVVLPLGYGKIKPANPLVHEGAAVKEGQLIAKPDNRESIPLFSPVPGVVKDIRKITLPDGDKQSAIIIELSGTFNRKSASPDLSSYINVSPEELWKLLYARGLARHSQPALPPYLFMPLPGKKAKTLIVRCFPNQPWDNTESIIFRNMYREMMIGLHALVRTTMPQRLVLFLEKDADYQNNSEKIFADSREWGVPTAIMPADDFYPSAHDFMLIEKTDGTRLKYGDIPAMMGYVIVEPSTLIDVYNIIAFDRPVLEQLVSVGGDAIGQPTVCKIKKGMPVFELVNIKELSLKTEDVDVFWGGPMTGYSSDWLGSPVLPGISAITVNKRVRKPCPSVCIKCASCSAVCPRNLEPMLLYDFIESSEVEKAFKAGLGYCIECGLCSFVCQSSLPLSPVFSQALKEVNQHE
ncbi:hypothetical protein WKV44_03610 [Spirochaetia bacterium 38H-sp]|uniref:4Fe-4S ferredoxin-type domain-containing protein n=1 Tax=Rarispira pelagica TaxID=3141764 RepID=A0ABU9UAD6_9SPIR